MIKINKNRIIIFILVAFIILNASWFLIISVKYNKYVKDLPKFDLSSYGAKKEDGYNYHVKKPDYLHYTGNLAISNSEKGEFLIIWPLLSGGYKYSITIQDNGVSYYIYVDENMNPVEKDDTDSSRIFQEHKASFESLLSKANEMWQLE
ncbi:MAG: hypothetical protein RSA29_04020 [Clostridium sp.]|uniref:hypothetical protein n=1 Tax=Clostridium sp. TaxID=1506 RepID=UPI00303EDE81